MPFGFGKKTTPSLKVVKPKPQPLTPSTIAKTKANLDTDPFSPSSEDSAGGVWPFSSNDGKFKAAKNLNNDFGLEKTEKDATESTSLLGSSSKSSSRTIKDPVSFLVVCFTILIGDTARGVMFPTLWLLNKSLGGNKITQGYAVASFSGGRVLMSPVLGRMSETLGYKPTLTKSLSMLLLGTLLYVAASTPVVASHAASIHSSAPLFLLIFAQVVMGLGSGTLGVTRAYVAEITPRDKRTAWLSYLTAVQYSGFTVMPVVGAFICRAVKEGGVMEGGRDFLGGYLSFNEFSMPAWFMVVLCSLTLILTRTVFTDRKRAAKAPKKAADLESGEADFADQLVLGSLTRFDATILGCMLLNVATKGSIAVYETLAVNFSVSHFVSFDAEKAGFVVSSCGAMGVVALLCMGLLGRIWSDVQMITGGMIVMCIGTGLLVHFGDHSHFGETRFTAAVFLLYSIGYPIGHTAVIGIFSKIVSSRPQGALLGYFASAGSLARMFFPILAGYVAQYEGNSGHLGPPLYRIDKRSTDTLLTKT
ncbi:hypothetical protein TrRE_jg9159 [Triparma retinervis]|uniref:Major facilitator superfamily (MFS) profile domain-containing protein n=1 Tax=Triparma retinervis TaxID=2557542 RepID=A0A9W7E538_9STRA|nr:hypothetical protein TrRE_jg9159 [Triparma retinervis]